MMDTFQIVLIAVSVLVAVGGIAGVVGAVVYGKTAHYGDRVRLSLRDADGNQSYLISSSGRLFLDKASKGTEFTLHPMSTSQSGSILAHSATSFALFDGQKYIAPSSEAGCAPTLSSTPVAFYFQSNAFAQSTDPIKIGSSYILSPVSDGSCAGYALAQTDADNLDFVGNNASATSAERLWFVEH
jgi:hypothetical protein